MADDTDNTAFWAGAIGLPLVLAFVFGPMLLLNGFVLETLWNWFAAPFTTIRLTIPEAVGLSCLLTWVKGPKKSNPDAPKHQAWKDLGGVVILLLTLLAIGGIAHLFMAAPS